MRPEIQLVPHFEKDGIVFAPASYGHLLFQRKVASARPDYVLDREYQICRRDFFICIAGFYVTVLGSIALRTCTSIFIQSAMFLPCAIIFFMCGFQRAQMAYILRTERLGLDQIIRFVRDVKEWVPARHRREGLFHEYR